MISNKTLLALQQSWMRLAGPKVTCDIIHPGTSCMWEVLVKCATVLKQSSRLYIILYLTMFLLRIKKIIRQNKTKKFLVSFSKDFLGSLAFMSWLVGGMKMALCILNKFEVPLDIKALPFLSLLGSPSLMFIEKSRRGEVSYFVTVRAVRSFYIFIKRRLNVSLGHEKTLCFVIIFGIVSYLYYEGPKDLKHRQFLDSLWGEA